MSSKQPTTKQHAALLKRAIKADNAWEDAQWHVAASNFLDDDNPMRFEELCPPPITEDGEIGGVHDWLDWIAKMHTAVDDLAKSALEAQDASDKRWVAIYKLAGPDADSDEEDVWSPALEKAFAALLAAQEAAGQARFEAYQQERAAAIARGEPVLTIKKARRSKRAS